MSVNSHPWLRRPSSGRVRSPLQDSVRRRDHVRSRRLPRLFVDCVAAMPAPEVSESRAAEATEGQSSKVDAIDAETEEESPRLLKERVEIVGLQAKPEYNARKGVAVSFDRAVGRYAVELDGSPDGEKKRSSLKVREANLRLLPADERVAPIIAALTPTLAGSETRRALVEELHTLLSGVSESGSKALQSATARAFAQAKAAEVLTQIEHSMRQLAHRREEWHDEPDHEDLELPSAVCRNDINYPTRATTTRWIRRRRIVMSAAALMAMKAARWRYWVTRWR